MEPIKTPIKTWIDLISLNMTRDGVTESLKGLYKSYRPYSAGMIVTADCRCSCSHCIYPDHYEKYHNELSVEQWEEILKRVYEELEIRTFVHNGRSLNAKALEVINYVKKSLPGSRVGVIDNGLEITTFIDDLKSIEIDWIDISLDGMEGDHDLQRRQNGSFNRVVENVQVLNDAEAAPKVNILTCLTNLNKKSVVPMLQFLNEKGLKNLFISPVSVLRGHRPDEGLMVRGEDFNILIHDISEALNTLNDAWIEISIFDAEYMHFIQRDNHNIWDEFKSDYDHLFWKKSVKNNEFAINYYPLSLDGLRELIINCNGDVIPPKVMAKGNIPQDEIAGSLLSESPLDIVGKLYDSKCFNYYMDAFFMEKNLLKGG